MSIDTSYFGDTGETIGQAGGDAVARYLGTIKNWMAKRSGDPKLYVIFDGEGRAVACPVATMTEERYGWALEPFLDGSPAPVYVEPAVAARPRRDGSARPAGGGERAQRATAVAAGELDADYGDDGDDDDGSQADAADEEAGDDDDGVDDDDDESSDEETDRPGAVRDGDDEVRY